MGLKLQGGVSLPVGCFGEKMRGFGGGGRDLEGGMDPGVGGGGGSPKGQVVGTPA